MCLVGRSEELARLAQLQAATLSGTRRVVFITGEAGIGKTALVQPLLRSLPAGAVGTASGQCIEQYGPGAPYLPVFEALGARPWLARLDAALAARSAHPRTKDASVMPAAER